MNISLKPNDIDLNPAIKQNHLDSQTSKRGKDDIGQHRNAEQSVPVNSNKLVEKILNSPFQARVKRSSVTHQPATATNQPTIPSQEGTADSQSGNEVLEEYHYLIELDRFASIPPTCTNGMEGQPNPPVYSGYQSWEAFLASDGANPEIKNPRQEFITLLRAKISSFIINRSRELLTDENFNDFKSRLNSSQTPEAARAEFERYRTIINNRDVRLRREIQILTEAIRKKMIDAIRSVKHNTPNRWIQGHCWSSTTRLAQWNERWNALYLPKALQAITAVEGLETSLIPPRQIWAIHRQKAIDTLKTHASSKRWNPPTVAESVFL